MKRIVSTRIILLACLLSGSASAIAQAPLSFEPGFVVLAAGDTLRGEVALEADLVATRRATFRSGGDAQPTTYGPEELLAYGTDGGLRYEAIAFEPARQASLETLFLRPLVLGKVSLYTYALDHRLGAHESLDLRRGPTSERFAIRDAAGNVTALYVEQTAVRVDGTLHSATDRQYQRALAVAFAPCPEQQRRAGSLRYARRDLIAAVVRFNECAGAPVFGERDRPVTYRRRGMVEFTVRAGLSGTRVYQPGGPRGSMQATPYAGLVLELHPVPGANRVTLPVEISVRSFAVAEDVLEGPFVSADAKRQVLTLSLGPRYHVRAPYAPTVSAGIVIGRLLGERRGGSVQFTPQGTISLRPWSVPPYEGGLYAEAGVRPGRFSLALRLEATDWGTLYPFTTLQSGDSGGGDFRTRNVLAVAGFRF